MEGFVNIASIAGKEGNPKASHYSAAKAGVIGLTQSLGKELVQSGVLVNAVAPAVIQTNILEQCSREHVDYMVSRIPMKRMGKAAEVAALAVWLCGEECSFSTGAVFDISGGGGRHIDCGWRSPNGWGDLGFAKSRIESMEGF